MANLIIGPVEIAPENLILFSDEQIASAGQMFARTLSIARDKLLCERDGHDFGFPFTAPHLCIRCATIVEASGG